MTDRPRTTPHENTLAFAAILLKRVTVHCELDDETLVELAVQTTEAVHRDPEARMDALNMVGALVKTAMLARRASMGKLH